VTPHLLLLLSLFLSWTKRDRVERRVERAEGERKRAREYERYGVRERTIGAPLPPAPLACSRPGQPQACPATSSPSCAHQREPRKAKLLSPCLVLWPGQTRSKSPPCTHPATRNQPEKTPAEDPPCLPLPALAQKSAGPETLFPPSLSCTRSQSRAPILVQETPMADPSLCCSSSACGQDQVGADPAA
jgi:hypothetical protein